MEDGGAGPPLAQAAEARARPGVTPRPFAPFAGAAGVGEGGGDWSFIDCEMEEVDLRGLPCATIACHLDPRVFADGLCRVSGERAVGGRADACCGRRRAGRGPRGRGEPLGALPGSPVPLGWVALPEGRVPSTCRRAPRPAGSHRLPARPLPGGRGGMSTEWRELGSGRPRTCRGGGRPATPRGLTHRRLRRGREDRPCLGERVAHLPAVGWLGWNGARKGLPFWA